MVVDGDIYCCLVCGKFFDFMDWFFDFVILVYEKDYWLENSNLVNMIWYDDGFLMWCCKICGVLLYVGEYIVCQMIIGYCWVVYDFVIGGFLFVFVMVRGGWGFSFGLCGFGELVEDVGEVIVDGVGWVVGGIFRVFGGD